MFLSARVPQVGRAGYVFSGLRKVLHCQQQYFKCHWAPFKGLPAASCGSPKGKAVIQSLLIPFLSSLGWWGWLIFTSFHLQYFISRCWYIFSLVIVSYCSSWWSFLNSLRLIWPFPVSPLWHSCWSIGIKQHSVTTPVDVLCLYSLHRKVQYWRPLVFWSSHWGTPAFTSPGWWLLCCRPVRPVSARSSVISAPWTYYW